MTMQAMMLTLLVIVLTAVPVAAQKEEDESLNCLGATQKSGAGENFFETCVSDTGSVPVFRTRAGGGDNIASDGYMICDAATGGPLTARAWSRGYLESNLSFPTTKTSASNVRTTADGRYRLSQSFVRDPIDKQMVITMTLKNLGPGSVTDVRLQRFIDVDANGGASNIYVAGADTILATSSNHGRGVVMGVATPEISHDTFVEPYVEFNAFDFDSCFPGNVITPTAAGDFTGFITFNLGTMAAGASKIVKIYYRKF